MQPDTKPKSKGLGAEVAKVTDLVSYQDGSIVSREIVKKPAGSVTVFAFDEGQGLSEHIAPFDALVQVLEGEAEITRKHTRPRPPPARHSSICCAAKRNWNGRSCHLRPSSYPASALACI